MRLLYFSQAYTTHDRRFLAKMAESSHEVWFLRLEQGGISAPLPDGVRELRWEHPHGPLRTPRAVYEHRTEFESLLAELRPDLVHAGPVQTCGYLTALTAFHPLVLMSWGSDILVDSDRDDEWRHATHFALSKADRLVCDCQAVRRKVQQILPFPDERILELPWGVDDLSRFASVGGSGLRAALGWQNAHVVISTRTWEEIYGVDVVVRAFQVAHGQNPNLRLVLLGDGSQSTRIKQYLADHDLTAVVHCPGRVSEDRLPTYFQEADTYLTCAYSDGTSISLLEAMATGLPVVCTDIPGNREWVLPNVHGWLAPVGDAHAFARALLQSADLGPDDRQRIARGNRAAMAARANWQVNSGALLALYDHLAPFDQAEGIQDIKRG